MSKKEYLEEAERLQSFINYRFSGVKKRFAEAIEVSEANASKYINGWQVFATESSFEKLRRVGLNPEWYLTGEGDMIYENKVERELLTGDYKSIDVRVYEAPAHALDGVLIDNLDNLASTVHNVKIREKYLNPDKIIGFRAKGNSMVGRGILDGDLLLVSEQMTSQAERHITQK